MNHAMVDYGGDCMGPSGTWECVVAGFVLGLLAGPPANLAKTRWETVYMTSHE